MSQASSGVHRISSAPGAILGRQRPAVKTSFSAGETRILEEMEKMLESQLGIQRRMDQVVDVNNSLFGAVTRLQGQFSTLSEQVVHPQNGGRRKSWGNIIDQPIVGGRQSSVDDAITNKPHDSKEASSPWLKAGTSNFEPPHIHYAQSLATPRGNGLEPNGRHPGLMSSTSADLTASQGFEDQDVFGELDAHWPSNLAHRKLHTLSEGNRKASIYDQQVTSHTMHAQALEDAISAGKCIGMRRFLKSYIVFNPNSRFKMFFDMSSLIILAYDLCIIPYLLAWSVSTKGVFQILSWITVTFWSLDIVLTCLTGIVQEGKVVKDPRIITRKYAQTWLLPDLAIVLSDWLSMVMTILLDNSSNHGLKMLRFAKLGRLFRVLGMFKVFRFARVIEEFLDRSIGETYRMTMRIVSIIAIIVWINHMMCCGWFAIGINAPSDTGDRWVDDHFLSQDLLYQYWTTFHWSLTQITLGATEVVSGNTIERIYTVICLVFGLLFGSTLVSSLSATMVEFQMLRNGRHQKLRLLRQFLSDHAVDLDISYLVQKQVKERLGPTDKLQEGDVKSLELLSHQLLSLLRREIYGGHLVLHPLFNLWSGMDPNLFGKLCNTMTFHYLRQEDTVFSPGPADAQAYHLISGALTYCQVPVTSRVTAEITTRIKVGAWIAEPALWCVWIHVGTAEALQTSELLVLTEEALNAALQMRHPIRKVVQQYGEIYWKRIKRSGPPDGDYPSDLVGPSYEDIVMAMDKDSQIEIGQEAMKRAAASKKFWDSPALTKLKEEVSKGKSTVMVNEKGEINRVVYLVAVKVENNFEQILTQVGVYDKEKQCLVKECQLPGQKQERSEEAVDAAKRCLTQKVGDLAEYVDIKSTTREVEYKQSKEYGVRTKYIRTVCRAVLKKEFDLGRWQLENNLACCTKSDNLNNGQNCDQPSNQPHGCESGGLDLVRRRLPSAIPGLPPIPTLVKETTISMDGAEEPAWDIYAHMGASKVFFYSWINRDELSAWLENGEAMVKRRLDGFNYDDFQQWVETRKATKAPSDRLEPVQSVRDMSTPVSLAASEHSDQDAPDLPVELDSTAGLYPSHTDADAWEVRV